jgi:hypothetical protein
MMPSAKSLRVQLRAARRRTADALFFVDTFANDTLIKMPKLWCQQIIHLPQAVVNLLGVAASGATSVQKKIAMNNSLDDIVLFAI